MKNYLRRFACATMATVLLTLNACGDPGSSYFPLESGYWWEYVETVTTMDETRANKRIIANADPIKVDGETVYPRHSVSGYTYYYRADDDGVLRIGGIEETSDDEIGTELSEAIAPNQYVLRFPLEVGTTWTMRSETAVLEMSGPPFDTLYQLSRPINMRYEITSLEENVRVAAGDFSDCLRIDGSGQVSIDVGGHLGRTTISVETTDWYAPDVGLVKSERVETTTSQVLNRGSYQLELNEFRRL
ncbi:MAG: hypothetical protein WD572_06160 [Gammaproteobacteria bacterium]